MTSFFQACVEAPPGYSVGGFNIQLSSWNWPQRSAAQGQPGRESSQDGSGLPGPTWSPVCVQTLDSEPPCGDPGAWAAVACETQVWRGRRMKLEGIPSAAMFPVLRVEGQEPLEGPGSFPAPSGWCPGSHWPPSSPACVLPGL